MLLANIPKMWRLCMICLKIHLTTTILLVVLAHIQTKTAKQWFTYTKNNMPTPEEIKKIAAEIAEVLYNEDKFYNHHLWWNEEPKECKAKEVEDVINVILRDYCIVPKSELRKVQKEVNRSFQDGDKISESEWERIFNWLFGKSLFEEEKK